MMSSSDQADCGSQPHSEELLLTSSGSVYHHSDLQPPQQHGGEASNAGEHLNDLEPWIEKKQPDPPELLVVDEVEVVDRNQPLNVEHHQLSPADHADDDPQPIIPPWCTCHKCEDWDDAEMNICCKDHPIWDKRRRPEDDIHCATSCQDVVDILRDGPLRLMYQNYCSLHPQRYPPADDLQPNARWSVGEIQKLKCKQRRFSAYRAMVFWAFPNIRRKERHPLPSCIYMLIRALYPPSDDEEEFANHIYSRFIPDIADD